jgi:hypothetical protein
MTVPKTLAVVLDPASGLEEAESRRQKVPRHWQDVNVQGIRLCEERSNPEKNL